MPDENTTLNDDGINKIIGASSAPELSGASDTDPESGKVNTVDDPAVPSKTDDKAVPAGKEGADAKKAQDGEDERGPVPYSRFKEVNTKAKDLEAKINAEIEARIRAEERARVLEEQHTRKPGEGKTAEEEETLPFRDISKLTDEEIQEWMMDKPKEYAANLYLQIKHELAMEQKEKSESDKIRSSSEKTMTDFMEAHPDFKELWGSNGGKVLDYMNDHPGHTPMSAYYAMTEADRIQAAKEEAVTAERKKFDANTRAKRDASNVLGTGIPATGDGEGEYESKLKDTKKHGGIVSVLTQGLMAKRRAGPG